VAVVTVIRSGGLPAVLPLPALREIPFRNPILSKQPQTFTPDSSLLPLGDTEAHPLAAALLSDATTRPLVPEID
jgi:hypothetical protein